jgi:hypothetical protein
MHFARIADSFDRSTDSQGELWLSRETIEGGILVFDAGERRRFVVSFPGFGCAAELRI